MIYEIFPWAKGTLNDGSAPGDFSRTEEYVKEIYEALRSSPQWENTLWIITFDEHGGFADHVPSPKNVPNPDGGKNGEDGFPYDRLGVRIPTILVSPWLQKGKIVHGDQGTRPSSNSEYEHSSIVASIFKLLGMEKEVGLTDRTKWATTFENLLKERTEVKKHRKLAVERERERDRDL